MHKNGVSCIFPEFKRNLWGDFALLCPSNVTQHSSIYYHREYFHGGGQLRMSWKAGNKIGVFWKKEKEEPALFNGLMQVVRISIAWQSRKEWNFTCWHDERSTVFKEGFARHFSQASVTPGYSSSSRRYIYCWANKAMEDLESFCIEMSWSKMTWAKSEGRAVIAGHSNCQIFLAIIEADSASRVSPLSCLLLTFESFTGAVWGLGTCQENPKLRVCFQQFRDNHTDISFGALHAISWLLKSWYRRQESHGSATRNAYTVWFLFGFIEVNCPDPSVINYILN